MEILLHVEGILLAAVLLAASVEKYSGNHKHARNAEKALDAILPTALTVTAFCLIASIFQSFIN